MNDLQWPSFPIQPGMSVREPLADLTHKVTGQAHRKPITHLGGLLKRAPEIVALYVLHHEEVGVPRPADIEDLYDIRVVQTHAESGFIQEHLHEVGVGGQRRKNPLDRHVLLKATEAHGLAEKDLSHAAHVQSANDAVTLLRGWARLFLAQGRFQPLSMETWSMIPEGGGGASSPDRAAFTDSTGV